MCIKYGDYAKAYFCLFPLIRIGDLKTDIYLQYLHTGAAVFGPDVILYGAKIHLLYETNELPVKFVPFFFAVRIVETNFKTLSGVQATREEIMQVLQNLTAVYIKATYAEKGEITK